MKTTLPVRPWIRTIVRFVFLTCLSVPPLMNAAEHSDYALGADLSFLRQMEDRGTQFKEAGTEKPGLQIFRNHGYNWIRLRICVEPVGRALNGVELGPLIHYCCFLTIH